MEDDREVVEDGEVESQRSRRVGEVEGVGVETEGICCISHRARTNRKDIASRANQPWFDHQEVVIKTIRSLSGGLPPKAGLQRIMSRHWLHGHPVSGEGVAAVHPLVDLEFGIRELGFSF